MTMAEALPSQMPDRLALEPVQLVDAFCAELIRLKRLGVEIWADFRNKLPGAIDKGELPDELRQWADMMPAREGLTASQTEFARQRLKEVGVPAKLQDALLVLLTFNQVTPEVLEAYDWIWNRVGRYLGQFRPEEREKIEAGFLKGRRTLSLMAAGGDVSGSGDELEPEGGSQMMPGGRKRKPGYKGGRLQRLGKYGCFFLAAAACSFCSFWVVDNPAWKKASRFLGNVRRRWWGGRQEIDAAQLEDSGEWEEAFLVKLQSDNEGLVVQFREGGELQEGGIFPGARDQMEGMLQGRVDARGLDQELMFFESESSSSGGLSRQQLARALGWNRAFRGEVLVNQDGMLTATEEEEVTVRLLAVERSVSEAEARSMYRKMSDEEINATRAGRTWDHFSGAYGRFSDYGLDTNRGAADLREKVVAQTKVDLQRLSGGKTEAVGVESEQVVEIAEAHGDYYGRLTKDDWLQYSQNLAGTDILGRFDAGEAETMIYEVGTDPYFAMAAQNLPIKEVTLADGLFLPLLLVRAGMHLRRLRGRH